MKSKRGATVGLRGLISWSFVVAVALQGCADFRAPEGAGGAAIRGFSSEARQDGDLLQVHTIEVAPVVLDSSVPLVQGREKLITGRIIEAMTAEFGVQIVSRSDASADAVLKTVIYDLTERSGSRIGANSPAVVDFSMKLVQRSSGKTIWTGEYHFSDKAVTDNLFAIQKRAEGGGDAGWKNSEELLALAFRASARDISERRERQFTGLAK
jgi:hypothetical protein